MELHLNCGRKPANRMQPSRLQWSECLDSGHILVEWDIMASPAILR
jgi:hypothetical protein